VKARREVTPVLRRKLQNGADQELDLREREWLKLEPPDGGLGGERELRLLLTGPDRSDDEESWRWLIDEG